MLSTLRQRRPSATADSSGSRQPRIAPAPPLERVDLCARIDSALAFLLEQADCGFPEIVHEMGFPRRAGFRVHGDLQSSDVFARAVLAPILLDIAALRDDPALAARMQRIARREAEYVAATKLCAVAGGWSYFPGLPELPPDADSLAAATILFARVAPEHLALCAEPIELALRSQTREGGISTWIVSPSDPPQRRRRMLSGIHRYWGEDTAVDVGARFFFALNAADAQRYRDAIAAGVGYLRQQRQADGSWTGEWYQGATYPSLLAMELLDARRCIDLAHDPLAAWLRGAQREDGGWGGRHTYAQDTALALWQLARYAGETVDSAVCRRGLERLLVMQTERGYWKASPWIKMDIGRAQGRILRRVTHGSATLTTAFCLRSLLLLSRPAWSSVDAMPRP
jgi:hypothetical protein